MNGSAGRERDVSDVDKLKDAMWKAIERLTQVPVTEQHVSGAIKVLRDALIAQAGRKTTSVRQEFNDVGAGANVVGVKIDSFG